MTGNDNTGSDSPFTGSTTPVITDPVIDTSSDPVDLDAMAACAETLDVPANYDCAGVETSIQQMYYTRCLALYASTMDDAQGAVENVAYLNEQCHEITSSTGKGLAELG